VRLFGQGQMKMTARERFIHRRFHSSCCVIRKTDYQVRYLWRQCEPCAILICWTTILIAQPCHSSTISWFMSKERVYIKLIRNLSAAKRRSSTSPFTRKIRARTPETFDDPRDQFPQNDQLFFSFAWLMINLAYAKLRFFSCENSRSIIHFLNNHFETR